MWIKRAEFLGLVAGQTKAEAESRIVAEQNKVLQVNLDWLRIRVNQLEHERAQLLFNYTGIKIQTPEIQRQAVNPPHPLTELPSFHDVGDKEAARLGIEWDAEGQVTYK